MTLAEQLRREGWEEGYAEGLEEARQERRGQMRREFLLILLPQRFGPLQPADLDRIERADADTLGRWLDRVVTAPTLDDLLTG